MTAFMMERIAQTLAANQKLRLHMQGNEFRVIASTWPLSVSFFKGGAIVGSASGVLAGDYSRGMEFDGVEIANGATAQSVVVGLSNGSAGSDRITGSVEVIDGGKSRAIANTAFWAKTSAAAAVAMFPQCQLWNPAGSGKNLMIKKLAAYTLAGGYLECAFGFHDVQQANVFPVQPLSKMGGAVTSAGQARHETSAATLLTQNIGSLVLRSQTLEQYEFSEPFIVPPGKGFVLFGGEYNVPLNMNAEFFEESAT